MNEFIMKYNYYNLLIEYLTQQTYLIHNTNIKSTLTLCHSISNSQKE